MSTCPKCGTQNYDGEFCVNCGARLQEQSYSQQSYQQGGYQQQPYQQPVYQQPVYQQPPAVNVVNVQPQIPPEYQPLSPWAYFGYAMLFSIPIAGFILLIVFSFSSGNINRRNYARSYFCVYLILAIIVVIMLIAGVSFAGILGSSASYRY